jgi:hypothetical protein
VAISLEEHAAGTSARENPFAALVAKIDDHFAQGREFERYMDLALEVRSHCDAVGCRSLLTAGMDVWMPERAGSSTNLEHLGFTKVSLYRSVEHGYQIRLHVFWNGKHSHDASIHDHRWNITSNVLCGALRIMNYQRAEGGPEPSQGTRYWRHSFSDADAKGVKQVEELGASPLIRVSEYVLPAGASHALLYTEPHQVFNWTDSVSATLVVTGPPARSFSSVYTEERLTLKKTPLKGRLARAEVADAINRLSAFLPA